jgi:hypothetical protein
MGPIQQKTDISTKTMYNEELHDLYRLTFKTENQEQLYLELKMGIPWTEACIGKNCSEEIFLYDAYEMCHLSFWINTFFLESYRKSRVPLLVPNLWQIK